MTSFFIANKNISAAIHKCDGVQYMQYFVSTCHVCHKKGSLPDFHQSYYTICSYCTPFYFTSNQSCGRGCENETKSICWLMTVQQVGNIHAQQYLVSYMYNKSPHSPCVLRIAVLPPVLVPLMLTKQVQLPSSLTPTSMTVKVNVFSPLTRDSSKKPISTSLRLFTYCDAYAT